MKLKRPAVAQKYKELIDEFYVDANTPMASENALRQ